MPGLVGMVSENAVDEQLLDRMVNSIKHEESYVVDKYISSYFACARVHLGIFNPELQPIFNEDKSLCIFMDGKIYDYEEKMNRLKKEGYKFSFKNDSEFCLYSYEKYEINFVKSLNGSFVFVIYDLKRNKIIIVNDRYGLRPLYYTINNGKLLFASEVKAILHDKTFKKELNNETIADFFAFGGFLGNKTFFDGVYVLPPASIFIYDRHKLSIRQYWDFNYEPDYTKSEDEFVNELVKIFKKAVEIRMKGNYHYGVSLSGGLDSRVLVGAINETKRKDILAFSFGPIDSDEVKIAKKTAKKAGTKFKAIEITPEMIINNAEREIFYSDGMDYIGVSFIPPVYKVIKNDKIDIVFDGLAFDLILGGTFLKQEILDAKNNGELFEILHNKKRIFSDREFSKLFIDKYYSKIKNYPLISFKKEFNKINEKHMGNYCDNFFLQNHVRRWTIGGHILMRTAIENSVPTYDNNLIDLIMKIPPEIRLDHRIYRKFIIKLSPELANIPYNKTMVRADAPLLFWKIGMYYQYGRELIKRKIQKLSKGTIVLPNKRSYVNINEWLRMNEKWKSFFRELLLNKNAISKKYFNQKYIESLIQQHENEKADNSMKLLYLASFELFLRLFMDDSE